MNTSQTELSIASEISIETFYRVFRDISTLVHTGRSLKEVLDRVVWKATELLDAKGALLRVLNIETQQFDVAAAHGMGERYLNKGPVTSEKILTEEIRQNRVLIINDIWKAPRVEYPQEAWDEGIRMMLDIPLTVADQMIGLLRIYLTEKRDFSEDELSFIISIGEQCACAINKARLIETQKARYDQLAIHTEKMSALGRMAAGIAHEINNPLAGILLFSSNLSKKVPEKGPMKEGLDIIIRETVRCKTIIQELLEFSRDREPQKEMVNPNTILEKALKMLENEFRLHHIQIKKQLSDDLRETMLDENQIEQVFVNLLLNAVQAIEEKGVIAVTSRMEPHQKKALIEITDTGSGISSENMAKIFEPFFSTKPKGTGLGLAVSYAIVKNHQGDINAVSKPREGTRFVLEFPIIATSLQPEDR
ncbi:MAG: ATP-binding protein [Desulfobacterales bacterium]|jgi:signal transduction histidine kinase